MSKAIRSVLTGSLLAALESANESETAMPIAMEQSLYKGTLKPNYTQFNSYKKRKKGRS
jgi:hypothetical protein